MIKTKIKKVISMTSLVAICATSFGSNVFAATTIGLGSVTGAPAFDANIVWNDAFPGTASGSVSWIVVSAKVLPTLNMQISTWAINLWTLMPSVEWSWSINIEIGTNAVAWVVITAKSTNWGLNNTSNGAIQINNLTTDGNAENYTFTSTAWTIDSTVTGFATTGNFAKGEISDSTPKTIYTTNKPELNDNANADVVFKVGAIANAQTVAGNYTDNITFTVTGTF